MKILVVYSQIPYPLTNGSSLRLYNIFKNLVKRHKVSLLFFLKSREELRHLPCLEGIFTSIHFVKLEEKKRFCLRTLRNIISWNPGLMRIKYPRIYREFKNRILEIISLENIDVIHCHNLEMAEFVYDIPHPVKILDLVDCITLHLKREIRFDNKRILSQKMCQLVRYYKMRRYEAHTMQYFNACTTVGEKDFTVLKSLSPDANISVIPNGVDIAYFCPQPEVPEDFPSLVFSGVMDYPPNVDAVISFYARIFPIIRAKMPNTHLFIVGSSPNAQIERLSADENVTVTGYVDDIRPWIARGSVIICPMRMGAGMKNKILEAMALGKPVVSTRMGAEALNVVHGTNIMIADSPEEFAASILELISNQSLRSNIAGKGKELVETQYAWDYCATRYEFLYEQFLKCDNPLLRT